MIKITLKEEDKLEQQNQIRIEKCNKTGNFKTYQHVLSRLNYRCTPESWIGEEKIKWR